MRQSGSDHEVLTRVGGFGVPQYQPGDGPRAVEQNVDERSGDQHDGRHGRVGRG